MDLRKLLESVKSGRVDQEIKKVFGRMHSIAIYRFGFENPVIKMYTSDVPINELNANYSYYLVQAIHGEIIRLFEKNLMSWSDAGYYVTVEGVDTMGEIRSYEFWEVEE